MSHYYEHEGVSFGSTRTEEQIENDYLYINKDMMHRVAPITGILDEEFGYLRLGDLLVRTKDRMQFHIVHIYKDKIYMHNNSGIKKTKIVLKFKKVKRNFVKFKV